MEGAFTQDIKFQEIGYEFFTLLKEDWGFFTNWKPNTRYFRAIQVFTWDCNDYEGFIRKILEHERLSGIRYEQGRYKAVLKKKEANDESIKDFVETIESGYDNLEASLFKWRRGGKLLKAMVDFRVYDDSIVSYNFIIPRDLSDLFCFDENEVDLYNRAVF